MSTTTNAQVTLSFKLTRVQKTIEVWYRIENHQSQRLYVCDKLLFNSKPNVWKLFEGASLQNLPSRADTAQIVVGTPPTDADTMVVTPVTFRAIEPGQSFEATRKLSLPLESYNVMGATEPLDKKVKQAILVVQSFVGEPPSWRQLTAEDGSTFRVPDGFTPHDLISLPVPIPK